MHLGHPNGLISAAPHHDPVVECYVGPASCVLSHFKASGSLSGHVQSIGIPGRRQKYVIGDRRIGCLSKRNVERHPSDSTFQLSTSKILEPVFRAFNSIECHLPSVLELRRRGLGAADSQVAAYVQVAVCIHAEYLVEVTARKTLQDQPHSGVSDKLTGHAALRAV